MGGEEAGELLHCCQVSVVQDEYVLESAPQHRARSTVYSLKTVEKTRSPGPCSYPHMRG